VSDPRASAAPSARRLRAHELWLAAAVVLGAAYFFGGGAWNQNARLDAIFTFVEPGRHQWTFRINSFLPEPYAGVNTGDWTRAGAYYYANKAPGTIVLGALAYLPLYGIERTFRLDVDHPGVASFNAWAINLFITILPLAAAAVCWSRLLERRVGARGAVLVTLLTVFGTALFPYATQLWGHVTAAAFIMLALYSFERQTGPRSAVVTGVFAGIAVTCDYLALPAVLAISLAVVLRDRKALPSLILGGSGPALVLLAYQWYCFGNPLHLPTDGTNPAFVDHERALGLFGAVSPEALRHLLITPYRGIFVQMPVLVPALAGLCLWCRRDAANPLPWLCLGGLAGTVVWVATFNGWHGGGTVAARYLMVALPLLAIGLRELPAGRGATTALAAVGLFSVVNMLAIAAVTPLVDEQVSNPLYGETFARFSAGDLHPRAFPIRLLQLRPDFDQWTLATVWNWGDFLGLTGLWRVLPWALLVGTTSAAALRTASSPRAMRMS
jgi:hypothetical protein